LKESDAIDLLKQGDISGLEALVQSYYVPAVRTAYFVSLDRALAEDVAQAAFLHAYEHVDQFDAARPFKPWFLRIVLNDARMAMRKETRTVTLASLATGDEYAPLLLEIPASNPDLDQLLIDAETTAAVWAALGKLSPEQRAAIVLRYYLSLSENEMSAYLDCTPGTVKSRLHRAKRRLRQLLPAWLGPAS
jgi:RNA polymerase sigma-70 factor (ECF subfamily)